MSSSFPATRTKPARRMYGLNISMRETVPQQWGRSKDAITSAQKRLDGSSTDSRSLIPESTKERLITCAVLAWQQLGHSNAESLYEFIRSHKIESEIFPEICFSREKCTKQTVPCYRTGLYGPVVTLPVQTSVVMRVDNTTSLRIEPNKFDRAKDLMAQIDEVCCHESGCAERLKALDTATQELRMRASKLSKRESERIELFERAEAAWKDLEMGYKRRLKLAQEKATSIANQVPKSIEERNQYKSSCVELGTQFKQKGEKADADRANLVNIDQQICQYGCDIAHLRDEVNKTEVLLSKSHCDATQHDRDATQKEEHLKRRIKVLNSELESLKELLSETEHAVQLELVSIRKQVESVSEELLKQDADNDKIRTELEPIKEFMTALVDDLDSCKTMCDEKMKSEMDELKKKRDILKTEKEKFIECRCKLPVDEIVEVKRTPSVAVVCYCEPEDRITERCSCTSLRKNLMSNLLEDLFNGLQSELSNTGAEMPCQLLKCLEDSHNWDRSSDVKTHLRNFFANLLTGELDIAIATAIEKYHAKWIGNTCVDVIRTLPDNEYEQWQEKALENKAHRLANKLADQLFRDKEDELKRKAMEIVTTDPPCACPPGEESVYQCLASPTMKAKAPEPRSSTSSYNWERACQDVTQLRVQIENLKNESIKKQDLKTMEEKIANAVKVSMEGETTKLSRIIKKSQLNEVIKSNKNNYIEPTKGLVKPNKILTTKKKPLENLSSKKEKNNHTIEKDKPLRMMKQSYAVNLCLCRALKDSDKNRNQPMMIPSDNAKNGASSRWNKGNLVSQMINIKQSTPLKNVDLIKDSLNQAGKLALNKNDKKGIKSECLTCFHRSPSQTSIDKLLETLINWKSEQLEEKRKDETEEILSEEQKLIEFQGDKKSRITQIELNPSPKCPASTESEYMGAVNLEKSNDLICKTKTNEIDDKRVKSIFKCINSNSCNFIKQSESSNGKKSFNEPNNDQECQTEEKNVTGVNLSIQNIEGSRKSFEDIKYKIKFLGVTLTNVAAKPSVEMQKNVNQTVLHIKNDESLHLKENENYLNQNELDFSGNNESSAQNKLNEGQISQSAIKPKQISEIVNNIYKTTNETQYSMYSGDFLQTKDEHVDIQSFQNFEVNESECCVCCDKTIIDETEHLETNTFKLLEDHLRIKLNEIKSSCDSECITPEKEEEIFTKIITKVKRIISSSTNSPFCKCSEKYELEGSWERAYSLLQEYLKTKLYRVKCSCKEKNNDNTNAIPDVLTRVCQSIENDFKRLEELCRRKNNEEPTKEKNLTPSNTSMITQNEEKVQSELNSERSMELKGDQPKSKDFTQSIKFIEQPAQNNVCNNYYQNDSLMNSLPYIGTTVECSCARNLGPCSCSKSLAQANANTANTIWNNALNSNPDQHLLSYIMRNRCNDMYMYKAKLVESSAEVAPLMMTNSTQWINTMCDMEINTSIDEEVVPKKPFINALKTHVSKKVGSLHKKLSHKVDYANPEDWRLDQFDNFSQTSLNLLRQDTPGNVMTLDSNAKKFDISKYANLTDYLDHINERRGKYLTKDCPSVASQDCDCNKVPICHVKMLMENIEDKLVHSKCTCDSLSSKVCPVHANVI